MEEEELVELLPPEFTRGVVLMDFQCAVVPKADDSIVEEATSSSWPYC